MKDLLSMAIAATEKNVVKSSTTKNINSYLFEILFEKKQKLTKENLIGIISFERMSLKDPQGLTKIENVEQMTKFLKGENITVKNGFETSWSKAQNNSSFHFNETYKNYKLEKVGDLFQITLRSK